MTNTDKWAQLDVAMTASAKKTIKELFAEDKARAAKFTVEAAGWTLDYSKNRIDEKVKKALVKLAKESNLKEEIEKMFTGKKINAILFSLFFLFWLYRIICLIIDNFEANFFRFLN